MNQKTILALLACALPFAAACGNSVDPIGAGGSGPGSTSSSSASTGTTSSGGGGSAQAGTGGSAQAGACSPACGSGEVCVESSCHALVTLDASTGSNGCTIVLDSTHAYWATNEVRIVPKSGGQATSFNAWVSQPALAVDDTYLYFDAGNGGVARAVKTGKSGFTPFAGEGSGSPTHMVGDGSTLYFLEGADDTMSPAVFETPTTGTLADPTMMPAVFASSIYGIGTVAVDATSLYFWGGPGLLREDRTTLATTTLAAEGVGFDLNIGAAAGIVVDGATVYYSTTPVPGSGGVVASVSSAGGASTVVVDAKSGISGVFTVDATSIYYMTVDGVMKVAKTGGTPVAVSALNPPSPFATCMASDDTYVYWVDGLSLMQYKK